MESNTTLFNTSMDDSLNGTDLELPLYITYVKMILFSVALPGILTPTVLIICIIAKSKELQKEQQNHRAFLINLLVSDVIFVIAKSTINGILIILYLLDVTVYINCTAITILTLAPTFATKMMFLPLIIDRFINIAFPFDYKRVMTAKAVNVIIGSLWLLTLCHSIIISTIHTLLYLPSLGDCIATDSKILLRLTTAGPLVFSALFIISTSVYFYLKIKRSKRYFHQVQQTGQERNSTKHGRILEMLQEQLKPAISVFFLGGFDAALNLLLPVLFTIMRTYLSDKDPRIITIYTLQLGVLPVQLCQSLSHSLAYGIYSKQIRKLLCDYCKDKVSTRRSKVTVLKRK